MISMAVVSVSVVYSTSTFVQSLVPVTLPPRLQDFVTVQPRASPTWKPTPFALSIPSVLMSPVTR